MPNLMHEGTVFAVLYASSIRLLTLYRFSYNYAFRPSQDICNFFLEPNYWYLSNPRSPPLCGPSRSLCSQYSGQLGLVAVAGDAQQEITFRSECGIIEEKETRKEEAK